MHLRPSTKRMNCTSGPVPVKVAMSLTKTGLHELSTWKIMVPYAQAAVGFGFKLSAYFKAKNFISPKFKLEPLVYDAALFYLPLSRSAPL